MNENQYRKRWLRRHSQYEKIAYKLLMKGFRDLGNSIPFIFMTEDNYEDFLNTNLKQEQFINIYYNLYKEVGTIHGIRVGREINKQIKEFTSNAFLAQFERDLLTFLFDEVEYRITDVIVEGLSMSTTQRSEYSSIIENHGGSLSGLNKVLKQRLAE